MRFKTVFTFEFKSLIRKKSFIISTLIIMLVAMAGISLPKIIDHITNSGKTLLPKYGLVLEEKSLILEDFSPYFPEENLALYTNKEDLIKDLKEKKIDGGFVILSTLSFQEIYQDKPMSSSSLPIKQALGDVYTKKAFAKENIDYDKIKQLENPEIKHDVQILGKDSEKSFLHLYLYIMTIYFVCIMYGVMVATSVAREKNDRTMELLVTYSDTNSLIFGKVCAVILASIVQIVLILLMASLSLKLSGYETETMMGTLLDLDGKMAFIYFLFGMTGYIFLMSLYAGLGSLVSRIEDINTALTPLMFLIMAGFFISIFSLSSPQNMVMKIASFIPLTSMYAMPFRNAMASVPLWENILSYGLLFLFTLLMVRLSAKLYRFGTIFYGNKIKWISVFRSLK